MWWKPLWVCPIMWMMTQTLTRIILSQKLKMMYYILSHQVVYSLVVKMLGLVCVTWYILINYTLMLGVLASEMLVHTLRSDVLTSRMFVQFWKRFGVLFTCDMVSITQSSANMGTPYDKHSGCLILWPSIQDTNIYHLALVIRDDTAIEDKVLRVEILRWASKMLGKHLRNHNMIGYGTLCLPTHWVCFIHHVLLWFCTYDSWAARHQWS